MLIFPVPPPIGAAPPVAGLPGLYFSSAVPRVKPLSRTIRPGTTPLPSAAPLSTSRLVRVAGL